MLRLIVQRDFPGVEYCHPESPPNRKVPMSAKSSKKPSRKDNPQSGSRLSRSTRIITRLLNLPRLARILIAGVLALVIAFVITLVLFYDGMFYNDNLISVYAVVVLVFGLAMYLSGWFLIVGTVGETPPVRPAIVWYLGIGLVSIVLLVLWIASTLSIGAGAL